MENLPFAKKKKSLEELNEENERLRVQAENEDLQLTIEQRNYTLNKVKKAGLSFKNDFGSSLKRAWKWANK